MSHRVLEPSHGPTKSQPPFSLEVGYNAFNDTLMIEQVISFYFLQGIPNRFLAKGTANLFQSVEGTTWIGDKIDVGEAPNNQRVRGGRIRTLHRGDGGF